MGGEKTNYRRVLAERLSSSGSCFVLDAGTGAGNMTKALIDHPNVHVVSADANRRVFTYVRKKVSRNNVDFIACDFANLPFTDESFRRIICDLVISTSGNWRPLPIYAEFRRTLRTKDALYITDYYPRKTPQDKEEKFAVDTWKFYRDVSAALGVKLKRDFPPKETIVDLKNAGFRNVREERIIANESPQWKNRVFAEYYDGMKRMISGFNDPELKKRFRDELETLKKEIAPGREIHWSWGVNYLIEARK